MSFSVCVLEYVRVEFRVTFINLFIIKPEHDMAAKRPRNDIKLQQKYDMVKLLKRGWKQKQVADKFGVNESTVTRLKKQQEEILAHFEQGKLNTTVKRNKSFGLEKVDTALFEWFRTVAAGKPGISGALLQEKAQDFAKKLKFDDTEVKKIDINWINRFKRRHYIVAKKLHGEAAAVDERIVADWRTILLPVILRQYPLGDIFNIDEMGLFWRLLPDSTHIFKGATCSGGKRSKDRITVLCGASALGEKLPLFVIGKSKMPRCFRGEHVPLMFEANNRAWMTSDLFSQYVRRLDRRMAANKRKIALILDNCPAHPTIEGLMNITLFFLPANTTSHTQPMDAGVIRNVKHHYRLALVRRMIAAIDNQQPFQINLLQAVYILKDSWEKVTDVTIKNCFRHVGFNTIDEEIAVEFAEEQPADNIFERVAAHLGLADFRQYVDVDADLITWDSPSEEAILSLAGGSEDHEQEYSDDEIPQQQEEMPPSRAEAHAALRTIQTYLEAQDNGLPALQSLRPVEEFLTQLSFAKMRQTEITKFFNK